MEESIYNIIPRNPESPAAKPLYRSKFPHDIPPTGSTFALHTTSKPGVSNLSGEFAFANEAHSPKGTALSLGYAKGVRRSLPAEFQKKATGTMGSNLLPPIRNFSYDCTHTKERVPRATERPVFAKKSQRDFLLSNSLEAILSTPKRPAEAPDWTQRKGYGKTPEYLQKIKQALSEEYQMIRTLREQAQQRQHFLSEQETEEMRQGLKRKWSELNRDYQKMAHLRLFDTMGLRRRKDFYEGQMAQIEDDIRKLNKAYILIQK